MITLMFFIGFGYFVMTHSRPLVFAGLYTGVELLIPLILGGSGPLAELLVGTIIIFIYTSFVYFLVDRFGDGIFTPIAILAGGAILLFVAPIFFL